MTLDLSKLENVKECGGKTIAACPACREVGSDKKGNHLRIWDGGGFNCIVDAGKEHRWRILQLAGERRSYVRGSNRYSTRVAKPKPVCVAASKPKAVFPPLRTPTAEELATIARVRSWPRVDGLEVLVTRGMLFIGEVYDGGRERPAWIVTDPTRRNAQARRMDGQPWEGIGGAKAKSLRGTSAGRCIGASLIGEQTEAVWLMEGTPDLLAAPILAKGVGLDLNKLAFVCMTGTGNALHAGDLPFFVGKPVVIAVHNDSEHGAGAKAATRWAGQLQKAGAGPVSGFNFAAHACKDLSDYLAAAGDTRAQRAEEEGKAREVEPTGEAGQRTSDGGDSLNESFNTANGNVPSGLCVKSWARGIIAPPNGPTALGAAYVWPEFTREQIESDASMGGEW